MRSELLLTMPIYPPVASALEQEFTVRKLWTADDPKRYLRESCGSVRAVVTVGAVGLRPGVIEALPRLELIACFGNPRGTIDLAAASSRNIAVTGTPDDIYGTVAELAAGMTLALMRRIVLNDRFVRAGKWLEGAPYAGNTLIGKRCGIVGLGNIGREVAARLAAFGMTIAYQGPHRKADVRYRYEANVERLARDSDLLVVTCAATPQTRHLIDARVLQALGPEGFLVNVARGEIVDEAALIEALREQRIAGAALDVFQDEPRVPAAMMELENVVVLPHTGSTTREIRDERGRKLMANLRAHFAGEPLPHPVSAH